MRLAESGITPARRLRVWVDHLLGALQQCVQVIYRPVQPPAPLTRCGAQTPTGIAQYRLGIGHRGFGNVGQLSGDPQHRSLPSSRATAPRNRSLAAIERAR